jgi:hypothetical protein
MQMIDDEIAAAIEAEIEAALEAEVEARKAKMRADIVARRAHQAAMAHLDRVNARHPVETVLGGLTQAQENERQRLMAERRRADNEHLDEVNSRPIPGAAVRGLRPKRVDAAGGGVGFVIK